MALRLVAGIPRQLPRSHWWAAAIGGTCSRSAVAQSRAAAAAVVVAPRGSGGRMYTSDAKATVMPTPPPEDNLGRIKSDKTDKRSGKLIFVSHCLLNQQACVRGISSEPAVITPLIQAVVENNCSLYQMPCPEMTFLGSQRWGMVKRQYDTPYFRKHCREIADEMCDQMNNYIATGHKVVGVVMRDGSPTCGLLTACVESDDKQDWGGMVWNIPAQRFAATKGVYCEELAAAMKEHGLDTVVPLCSLPEVPEAGNFDERIADIAAKCAEPYIFHGPTEIPFKGKPAHA